LLAIFSLCGKFRDPVLITRLGSILAIDFKSPTIGLCPQRRARVHWHELTPVSKKFAVDLAGTHNADECMESVLAGRRTRPSHASSYQDKTMESNVIMIRYVM
jgi:hypothetical protein